MGLDGDDVSHFSKARDWKLSERDTDSRTKLEQFYVKHQQFFKNRQDKMLREMREEHGENATIEDMDIIEAEDLTPEQNYLVTNAELVEEAFMLIGISKQLEELEDLQRKYPDGTSSGWGSVIIVEEDEEESGNLISKGPSKITRQEDEIDEVMQSRYLDFLE